ncbi:MAG: hypothetical protein Q7U11_07355 [Phenylobacterium sp.]|uniref:hypothetical protein n=1 Tax=Phenylobacterium sp. TaxID=1871053 RepID=UPI002721DE14|nr:hypothetical protein [Phenylobacterium sp.]MDO8912184.1 hypothetical protein [Phenylobacterium sp.]MDO9246275.1 hypothetical protein [Phenylobacterium sp.]
MTSEPLRNTPDLNDVLYQFAIEHPKPDAADVDAYARIYPHHAAAITEFAIELATDALFADASSAVSDSSDSDVDKAMSRFHNRLYAVGSTAAPPASAQPNTALANPFASLDRIAMRQAAQQLHANSVFVMKLRDRQIRPETMSDGFRRVAADAAKAPLDVVIAHFAGQQTLAAGQRYKSDVKPTAGPLETFEEAVRSSGLSPEQEAYLLSL